MKSKDIQPGQRFGWLTTLRATTIVRNGTTRRAWLTQCECGTPRTVDSHKLLTGHTRSCGCQSQRALADYNAQRSAAQEAKDSKRPSNPVPPGLAHLPRRLIGERHPCGRSFTPTHLPSCGVSSVAQ